MTGGTLDLNGFNVNSGTLTLTNGGVLADSGAPASFNSSSYALQSGTVNAVLGGTGAVTKSTAGTVTLNAADTYTGGTTVSAGTLMLGNAAALGPVTNALTVSGGALDLNGYNLTTGSFTLSGGGAVNSSAGTPSLTSTVFNLQNGTMNVPMTGGGLVNKTTTNTVVLNGLSTYTGPTNVTSGSLQVATLANGLLPSSIGASSNASSNLYLAGGTLSYTGGTVLLDRGLTLGVGSGTDGFNVATGSATVTLGGPVLATGAGGIRKLGPGTLAFTNPSVSLGGGAGTEVFNDGGVVVTAPGTGTLGTGRLYVGATTGFTTPAGDTTAFLTLGTGGSYTIGGISVGLSSNTTVARVDTLNLINGTTLTTTANDAVGATTNGTGTTTLGVGVLNISGGSRFIHTGSDFRLTENAGTTGTVNLAGAGSGLFVNSGTLYLGDPGFSGINQGGGTIVSTVGNLTFGNTTSTSNAGIGTYNLGDGTTPALLTVGGSITKQNANSTATLNVNNGTIQANGSSATFLSGLTSANVLSGGVTFNTSGFNDTVAQSLSAGTGSTGGLTKIGAGTLTLSGTNTYAGPTTVNNGTLQYGSAFALPAGTALTVNGGGTLAFGGQALQPLGSTTPGLTLGSLNAAANSAFQFNLGSGSADFVNVTSAANVASGANITLAFPSGLAPDGRQLHAVQRRRRRPGQLLARPVELQQCRRRLRAVVERLVDQRHPEHRRPDVTAVLLHRCRRQQPGRRRQLLPVGQREQPGDGRPQRGHRPGVQRLDP